MKFRTVFFLVSCFGLLVPCKSSSANGYRALIGCGDGFLAAGSGGRMDWISVSGDLTQSLKPTEANLNALLSYKQTLYAAGDSGTLLISTDNHHFRKVEIGTGSAIHCLTRFNNQIVAGSDNGLLLVGDELGVFNRVELALEGNIVSLSANETACYGVTDKGEILHSTDGIHWVLFDFNSYYAGYYKSCQFTCVFADKNQISAAGRCLDGSPILMVSSQGTVWSERSLNFTDEQGVRSSLTEIPSSICLDEAGDQLLLACGKGQVMSIPSCSHCNKLWTISTEDLSGISKNGTTWLIVGADFQRHVLESGWE